MRILKKTNELLAGIQSINSMDLAPMSEPGELAKILEAEELARQAWLVSAERNGTAEEVSEEELEYLMQQAEETKSSRSTFEDYEDFI